MISTGKSIPTKWQTDWLQGVESFLRS